MDNVTKSKIISECENVARIFSPKKIGTPKRVIQLMSPNGYVEITPKQKKAKYYSSRRIDFLSK